ncbi:hypothetical protein AAG570_011663 [Ranatra chinensis]|uniref:Uncharacterized protein n=1 Tax=Ranatra chinensis TaxID=642074 RepID=A0ABD0YGJ2_9HEMI
MRGGGKLVAAVLGALIPLVIAAPASDPGREGVGGRAAKSLGFFVEELAHPEVFPEYYEEREDNELSARVRPQKGNSPIYYIRLPPSPYVLVPGLGYVSRPPSPRPPPVPQTPDSNLIRLPVDFLSNGKPTTVYSWDSQVLHLDKGPYFFNGRPTDIFLLRNTYNTLYDDGLQNFYP